MTDEEIISLVKAKQRGELIQFRPATIDARSEDWTVMRSNDKWNFEKNEYRIAPNSIQGTIVPTTWEQYCRKYHRPPDYLKEQMPFIGRIKQLDEENPYDTYYSNEFIALAKLIMLRDEYNQGWKPSKDNMPWYIFVTRTGKINANYNARGILYFKSKELGTAFMKNFKDLISEVGELIS